MRICIITIPYDSGYLRTRMGCGPEYLVQSGLADIFLADQVDFISIKTTEEFPTEIGTSFDLCRQVAEVVRNVRASGAFPLVLSGNCNTALGTIAGVDPANLGVIWFDGHGDMQTPDTSPIGYLDAMGLATAIGLCWKPVASRIPSFTPIAGKAVLHVGVRSLHPKERNLFDESGVSLVEAMVISARGAREALEDVLSNLRNTVSRLYLHIDLDVLDPLTLRANEYARPDGLSVVDIEEATRLIGELFEIQAIGFASYDPRYDPTRQAVRVVQKIVAAAGLIR